MPVANSIVNVANSMEPCLMLHDLIRKLSCMCVLGAYSLQSTLADAFEKESASNCAL